MLENGRFGFAIFSVASSILRKGREKSWKSVNERLSRRSGGWREVKEEEVVGGGLEANETEDKMMDGTSPPPLAGLREPRASRR